MAVQNTSRSYLGVAKESTKGTAVAPTDFIPVLASKLKPVDKIGELYNQGLYGSLVKNLGYIQGRAYTEFDFGGAVFADTFGYILGGLLGDVTTTGLTAPYTHAISLKNATGIGSDAQPTAFTFTDFYAANTRYFAGTQISECSLKFTADGLLDYDAKGMGFPSTTTSAPTPSFSTVLPTPVWVAQVTIGGSTVANAVDGNIDMARAGTPIFGLANTKSPYAVFLGDLEVKGKIRFVMENDTQLTNFLSNTQPAITINWSQGAGATATQIQFTVTKGAYVAAMVDRSKDFVEVEIDLNAQGNTTDVGATAGYSPIKWVLQNAKTSGTYQ